MELPAEFIRLPLRFDADRLAAEVNAIPEHAWVPHPQGFVGNSALLLVSAGGDPDDDALVGDMQPTPLLEHCDYLRQVLASFESPLGRTRLMRIDGHQQVQPHCDVHHYWRDRLRIHVPIVTEPTVEFTCGSEIRHMAAGECWVFDTWKLHSVRNGSDTRRIHLVVDTRGSQALWRRIHDGLSGGVADLPVPYRAGAPVALHSEGLSASVVMAPAELSDHIQALLAEVRTAAGCPPGALAALAQPLGALRAQWQALWASFAATSAGWPHYRAALQRAELAARAIPVQWTLGNGIAVLDALQQWILAAALHPQLGVDARYQLDLAARPLDQAPAFPAPVFIVAAPRSGSTLLFEALARAADAWTVGGESHHVIEGIAQLTPAAHDWHSNALDAADADPLVVQQLKLAFARALRDREGRPWVAADGPARLLEKTPKNALRIAFLARAFPDARFVYLVREPRANVSSILEAWRSGRFVTYEKLPDWRGGPWSMLLVPGWRALQGRSLAEVAVAQYCAAHEAILAQLAQLPQQRWTAVGYEQLLEDPPSVLQRLGAELGLEFDRPLPATLPPSAVTLTPPDPGKWQRNAELLAPHLQALDALAARVASFTGLEQPTANAVPDAQAASSEAASSHAASSNATATQGRAGALPEGAAAARAPAATPAPAAAAGASAAAAAAATAPPAAAPVPAPAAGSLPGQPLGPAHPLDTSSAAQVRALASVHTRSFAEVLERAGASLAVSTYQAGKLVLVRSDGAGGVNTHFREMRKPMGIACDGNRLAVGTANEIQTFHSVPAVTPRLDPSGRVDAAWLPRSIHFTGNIDIHEMAYANDGVLWSVNTRFSCLCTVEEANSFVPRWKPSFLTALAPEDRCHLNGLALRDGRVRYVTMLGRTDSAGGWRENKSSGGLLMDLDGERVLSDGLSMPHSPRWYRDRLWVLESGNGALCRVDPASGRRETVVELPGFTRGLDFLGPLAFIGLSQVRESAVFARLPITERLSERICGVWVVNIEQGTVVGFLRFEQAVQEVFAVQVFAGVRFPELVLPGDALVADAFVLPDEALRDVPQAIRVAAPQA